MATSDREKDGIKRFYGTLLAAVVLVNVALALLIFWANRSAKDHPTVFAWAIAVLGFGSILTFLTIVCRSGGRRRERDSSRPTPAWEYRSPHVFLGLPLVHIRVGGPREPVKAWFAAGGFAVGGLFAFGGLAIAPFSIGGIAIGLLGWGGMATGLLAMGGLAVGGWVFGGVAVGWNAYGACAIAWKAAYGAAALAHDFALGGVAQAAQASNIAAESYINSSGFFHYVTSLSRYAGWLNLFWVLPMLLWWRMAARRTRSHVPAALLTVALLFPLNQSAKAQSSTNATAERFDSLVREDFFSGNAARFQRGMKLCDDRLAQNSKYAPAISWKGAGDLSLAGTAFRTNDFQKGIELWRRGLKEMDDAVALEPGSLQVLIPRGATYLAIARYDPNPEESKHLIETGVADYEKALGLQQSYFDKLSRHSRGELLFGLADGWFRAGDMEKSRSYLRRILSDCPDSAYSKRAAEWLETKDATALKQKSAALSCIGCHGD